MIIAGPGMDIGGEAAALAADDQRQFGVGLQFEETIDHLHAGAFESRAQRILASSSKRDLQLDQRGDRLSGFGGLRQRPHDGRVVGGAVERLLDRDHISGSARRLLQELHDDVERFRTDDGRSGPLPDRGEDIAAMVAHALGMARHIGHEFQVGAVEPGQLRQFVHRQHAIGPAEPRRRWSRAPAARSRAIRSACWLRFRAGSPIHAACVSARSRTPAPGLRPLPRFRVRCPG